MPENSTATTPIIIDIEDSDNGTVDRYTTEIDSADSIKEIVPLPALVERNAGTSC